MASGGSCWPLDPEQYDAWYRTPRGAWIGESEFRLLHEMLRPEPGASLLDAGCGTGYFTRRFAAAGGRVTGLDRDPAMLAHARAHRAGPEEYLLGDMRELPFPDRSFDYCVSVTALCFVPEERAALAELARVSRRGVALGLLNRRSLLYLQKNRGGSSGAYRGAHWHTAREAHSLFEGLPFADPEIRYAVFLPSGNAAARSVEAWLPARVPLGAFLAAAAAKREAAIR